MKVCLGADFNREPKSILISEILFLVKQIGTGRTQVDDLRASVPILLKPRTFETVEGVTDPFAAADNALVLIVAKGTFITDSCEGSRSDVGIAYRAFAIAFVAEAPKGDAWCFAAHNEIGVMARHGVAGGESCR